MKLLKFSFINAEGNDQNVDLLVGIDGVVWENVSITKNQINDAIASYIENTEDWQYEELIEDVLKSFELDFEFVDVITFSI